MFFLSTALWAELNSARSIKIFGSLSDWAKLAMASSVCPVTLDLSVDPVIVGSGTACVSAGSRTAPATVLLVARGVGRGSSGSGSGVVSRHGTVLNSDR